MILRKKCFKINYKTKWKFNDYYYDWKWHLHLDNLERKRRHCVQLCSFSFRVHKTILFIIALIHGSLQVSEGRYVLLTVFLLLISMLNSSQKLCSSYLTLPYDMLCIYLMLTWLAGVKVLPCSVIWIPSWQCIDWIISTEHVASSVAILAFLDYINHFLRYCTWQLKG